MMEQEQLTERIIGCAMRVHSALGPGFLESVYQKALAHEMRKSGLRIDVEKSLRVNYDGVVVGEFLVDMLVEDSVLIEIKAVQGLVAAHEVQVVNYLTATSTTEIGLLLNFGADRLQVKRKYRSYRPRSIQQTTGQESTGA